MDNFKLNPSLKMQLDVRDNRTVLEDYARELNAWESEMKKKDKFLQKKSTVDQDLPPPRNKKVSTLTSAEQNTKRVAATDYDKWSKFDVEKACQEVDESSEEESSEDDEIAIEKSKELKNEGNLYVKKNDWVKALECYTKAINLYEGDAIYYANRALCYIKLEKWTKAEKDCCIALEIDPKYVKALQRRSVARAALGKLNLAINDMSEVIKLEPKNKEAREHLKELNDKLSSISNKEQQKSESENSIVKPKVKIDNNKSQVAVKDNSFKSFEDYGDDYAIVDPIFKAPHERSKKPLRRINVEEIDPSAPIKRSINTLSNVSLAPDNKIKPANKVVYKNSDELNNTDKANKEENKMIEIPKQKSIEKCGNENINNLVKFESFASESASKDFKLEEPKSSINFYNTWKQLEGNPEKRFEYLMMTPGEGFKKLFGSSLESKVLSEILIILSTQFIPNNKPVRSYLEGIKNVSRFNALKMFMSAEDKTVIKNLLKHSEMLGEIDKKEFENLVKIYEIEFK